MLLEDVLELILRSVQRPSLLSAGRAVRHEASGRILRGGRIAFPLSASCSAAPLARSRRLWQTARVMSRGR